MSCEPAENGAVSLGTFGVASVDRIKITITKDSTAWTGIDSVSFVFLAPDGETATTRAAVLETPDAGVWYYDTTVTDFLTAGDWTMNVRVTDGAVVKRYPYEISFTVNDLPGGGA